ncbi:MAG TPA: hypothetical protein VMZ90_13890 [Vicinamibacterales bacterium]|nr:hypothetical protein [Vicinamibacterales bacterium]
MVSATRLGPATPRGMGSSTTSGAHISVGPSGSRSFRTNFLYEIRDDGGRGPPLKDGALVGTDEREGVGIALARQEAPGDASGSGGADRRRLLRVVRTGG